MGLGSRGMTPVLTLRALGITFMAMMLAAVWLTYAVFTQQFTDIVPVKLRTSRIGLQLPDLADVKIRGVIVGEVRDMTTRGGAAVLSLAMDPSEVDTIPANVTAMILPKTLFGQKYVALQVPDHPTSDTLSAGDVIEDTNPPLELEKVMSDVYPLLRAVRPADLSKTLNAMATALEGRGARLGDNLVRLDDYLKRLNPQVPGMVEDLRLLTSVSDTYADVMPQLGRLLRNQVVTGNTVVDKEQELRALFDNTAGFADTTRDFLEVNDDNIIRLGQVSVPTLGMLARYSPEYPCLLQGQSDWVPRITQAYRGHTLHINLETIPHQPTGYGPADQPEYGAHYGPACATLPSPPYSQSNPGPQPAFLAGRESDDGIAGSHGKYRTAPGFGSGGPAGLTGTAITSGWAGTEAEQRVVDSLAAPVLGVRADHVPDVATLLLGPMARGNEVSVR